MSASESANQSSFESSFPIPHVETLSCPFSIIRFCFEPSSTSTIYESPNRDCVRYMQLINFCAGMVTSVSGDGGAAHTSQHGKGHICPAALSDSLPMPSGSASGLSGFSLAAAGTNCSPKYDKRK